MPFGLCNAPVTFQHFANGIYQGMLEQFVTIYLDNILVFPNDPAQYLEHVCQVLLQLQENHLYFNLEKCKFDQTSIEFLGYIIFTKGLVMAHKVTDITEWAALYDIKGIQWFLGFANFCRCLIRELSHVAALLTTLLKKGVPFKWFPEVWMAFEILKRTFTLCPSWALSWMPQISLWPD